MAQRTPVNMSVISLSFSLSSLVTYRNPKIARTFHSRKGRKKKDESGEKRRNRTEYSRMAKITNRWEKERWRAARSAATSPTTETDFESLRSRAPRPLGLRCKGPTGLCACASGPLYRLTGRERWEERPATPFPRTCSFSRACLHVCVWALCLPLPVGVPAQVAAPRPMVAPDGRSRNEGSKVYIPAYLRDSRYRLFTICLPFLL